MNPWSHVRDRSRKGIFLFASTIQPFVFLRLLTWGMSCPLPVLLRCAQEPGFPPQQKPRKLRGLPLNCSKKYPLPVNGCHPRHPALKRFAFCRVSIAGQIALPLRSATSEL